MARQKKINPLHVEETQEVIMSETKTLESPEVQTLDSLESELDRVRIELENTKRNLEEKKHELSSLPKRDISKEEIEITERRKAKATAGLGLINKIEKQKEYDNQLVTGKFINRRAPGNPAKLTYNKYADDPVKWYTFEDGATYTIPRGFADQLNEYYYTPHFVKKEGDAQFIDPNRPSSAINDIDTSNKKYAFVPISF